mgnify:FL=1
MLIDIDRTNLSTIRNPAFRAYAAQYVEIEEGFREQVRQLGLEFEEVQPNGAFSPEAVQDLPRDLRLPGLGPALGRRLAELRAQGAVVRNGARSVYSRWISPACLACQTGVGSATFFTSLRCHRQCFYCFNPNQEGYEHFLEQNRDGVAELEAIHQAGLELDHVALTGGEPLLHPEETIAFFAKARELYPKAYLRLYTSGDHLDGAILERLRDAGLDEIRVSIRLSDSVSAQERTLERLALARRFLPVVMVEMPVFPDAYQRMTEILLALDQMGVDGINLLEFCYPLVNGEAFRRRGYRLKAQPYRVLYNYWYAGGLPVAGSEEVCLDLVAFALERELNLGVHYCSLENKHTGQLFRQNAIVEPPAHHVFSAQDYFFKSAKAFGDEVGPVVEALRQAGESFTIDSELGYVEFPAAAIRHLEHLDVELAISTKVMEADDEGLRLREVKVSLTRPAAFDPEVDL